jgi:hypothetical protein
MKKQTAIEWLWRWINDNQEATIEQGNKAFEQAKEMEKEQIIDAHKDSAMFEMDADRYAEQYYTETYGKD